MPRSASCRTFDSRHGENQERLFIFCRDRCDAGSLRANLPDHATARWSTMRGGRGESNRTRTSKAAAGRYHLVASHDRQAGRPDL